MYSNWGYLKAGLALIAIILTLAFGAWAFTVGPCATVISEMPSWCVLLLRS